MKTLYVYTEKRFLYTVNYFFLKERLEINNKYKDKKDINSIYALIV